MVAQIDRRYVAASPRKTFVRLLSYGLFEGRPLTTRGRWINPLVFALAGRLMSKSAQVDVNAPIFIVGQGRSGTTILGVVLSLHRHVGFLNEPKALWHAAYPSEDLIGNYTDAAAHYVLSADDASDAVAERLQRLYAGYLRMSGCRRVVDKYPELLFRIPFVQRVFPDAKFLVLVRNGMDVCRSIGNWSATHGTSHDGSSIDWWGKNDRKWHCLIDEVVDSEADLREHREYFRSLTKQSDRAALEWILTMRAADGVTRRIPEHAKLIRYENLTNDPQQTLGGILEFCSLPADEKMESYALDVLRPRAGQTDFALDERLRAPFESMMKTFSYA